MKCVIMAGGKGTRISSIAKDIPKPMIKIGDMPVLEHEIGILREQGFKDIIITISHLGDIIRDYFGDGSKISPITGESFGVNIEYYYEEEPLGNAGALYEIRDSLSDAFLLINADAIFDVDFSRMISFHEQKGGLATILTHPNSHPYDSAVISVDDESRVTEWINKEDIRPIYFENRVNAGIHILSRSLLDIKPSTAKVDLDRQILKPLVQSEQLFAYDSTEYVRDMGTPERYQKVNDDFSRGIISQRCLSHKQKAIFLDRDGTINRYVGFLTNIDDFELIEDSCSAIKEINSSQYLAIVITNQPVVARGEVSFSGLKEIHRKMQTLLGNEGAYLDDVFVCPHHPDKGFAGEIPELKRVCDCRKPKPGLFFEAARKYNIDLSQSWMIGDRENDILAGKNAGCKTALIGNGDFGQDFQADNILDIVKRIIHEN